MKKRWIVAALVVIIIAAAAETFRRGRRRAAAPAMHPVAAETASLEETVEATGEVVPFNRVEIKPPIAGRIEALHADEGSPVRRGQILARMSSSDRAAILDAARAKGPEELARWEDTYKATPIIAPLAGTVILRNAVVGQTVDLSTVLFALADKLIVLAHVDEADIARIRIGMPVRVTLDAYPKETIPGRVRSILYEGKNVSNVITYGVKVEPEQMPPFFRSQMTASVAFVAERRQDVLVVPSAAVKRSPDGQTQVMVPGPKGRPVARPVEVGRESGDKTEIVSGLEPGQIVLVSGRSYVPQKSAADSPLIMKGPSREQRRAMSGGGGRRRPQGQGQAR